MAAASAGYRYFQQRQNTHAVVSGVIPEGAHPAYSPTGSVV